MIEAQLAKASTLKKIIESIKDLIDDATFDCTESGIYLQAMDASHVALVSLNLPFDIFEAFRCQRRVALGLNFGNVVKALKCANNDDACIIRYTDDDPDNFLLAFHDPNKNKIEEVSIRLMDIASENLTIPERDYDVIIDMESSEFAKISRDISQFSDFINIIAEKDKVTFSGNGDIGSNVILFDGESDSVKFDVKTYVSSTFCIKYMLHFAKASTLSDRVRLSFSHNIPMVVEFDIEESGYLRYYLALKIDDD